MATNNDTSTAKTLPVQQRTILATARNDITIDRYSTILSPLDDTLIERGGGKGLKIYDEIARDPFAYALLNKRTSGLIRRGWVVEPTSESDQDKNIADFITAQLTRLNFDQICIDLLDATLKGFAVAEICWKKDGATIVPDKIIAHDQRRFVFDEFFKPRLLTIGNMLSGEELPERKFIVHRFGVKGNNPYGLGLGSKLFWPILFKREGVAFWLTALEKFASPTPVAKYPQGSGDNEQQNILNSLMNLRQSGAIVLPLGAEVSFLEAAASGSLQHETWCEYWDMQMSICVFGSNLGTQISGQGARAASETHSETEQQFIDSDGDLLSCTLQETLIAWLVEYNFPGNAVPCVRRPRSQDDLAVESLRKARADNAALELKNLFDVCSRLPSDKISSVISGLSAAHLLPSIPDDVIKEIAPFVGKEALEPVTLPRNKGVDFADHHDHGRSDLTEQLQNLTQPMMMSLINSMKSALDKAEQDGKTLQDFSNVLLENYADLTIDALGNVIAPALITSELNGRLDVSDALKGRK